MKYLLLFLVFIYVQKSNNMAQYSADQIIGKSLVARVSIPLKRLPDRNAATVYTVKPGQAVGVVYSYTGGRGTPLWWAFYDQNGKPYYVEHSEAAFDIGLIKEQGALSVEEEKKKEDAKKKAEEGGFFPDIDLPNFDGLGENLGKYAGIALIVVGGIVAYNMTSKK